MSRILSLLLSVALAGLLYMSLIAGIDGERTLAAMGQLHVGGWAAILGLSLFNYALRFARWHGYLHWLGARIGLGRDGLIYLSGFALTTTPGKAGEGLRSLYLALRGVPYAYSLAVFFAERFLDLLAIALLAILVLVSFSNYVWWVVIPIAALVALLFALRQQRLLDAMLARYVAPQGRVEHLMQALAAAWERGFVLLAPAPLYTGLALGLVAWAAEGLSLYLIAHALGADIGLVTALGIYAASMLVGALSFVPGGLGGTEAVMALLLKLSGVASAEAIAITLIARVATLWFAVAIGLIALAVVEYERRRAQRARLFSSS